MADPIRFLATLAGTNSSARWLGISREGDSKLVFDVPAESLGQVMRLANLGDKVLKITVETE